jgi:hypothetical protein
VPDALANSPLTTDDLKADMRAILGGDAQSSATPAAQQTPPADPGRPMPDAPNTHSVFEAIAQSMQYANSFDLGTFDLQGRFNQFDRVDDARRGRSTPAQAETVPTIPADDYRDVYHMNGPWSDLPGRRGGCGPSGLAMSVAPERSLTMFDTGEHVLTAGDLYVDQLRVGSDGSVLLSYGQILSMPDLFESVDELRAADPAELRRLKDLIVANTTFYREGKRNPSLDVSNERWDVETNGRYLQLAEDNYSHFSPPSVIGVEFTTTRSDNRSEWIKYHHRAAHEMRALLEANPAAPQPTSAMGTNAFGDHFLTDAFAAGHMVNKELIIDRFRRNFFNGAHLNDAGKNFFSQVAKKSFHGRVAAEISKLETASYPLCVWGFCIPWRPNIDSADLFAKVLQQAAEAEPVKIGNLAAKALHDHLNRTGVAVTNDAGDAWTVFGDGHMNDDNPKGKSLEIMRRAVQQSVDNMLDPAILAPTLDMVPLIERVFRYLPKITPTGLTQVTQALATYTDPTSAKLVDAAAALVGSQLDSLVKQLLKSGKLQNA